MPRAVVATGAAFLLLAALLSQAGGAQPVDHRGRVYVSMLDLAVNWLTPGPAVRWLAIVSV
ncbi:MAG: hypothetical protein ACXWMG_02010 [Candidatus Limnocylindria bacterium]